MRHPLTGLAVGVLLTAGCATRGALGGLEREMALLRADLVDLRHAQQIASRDLVRARDDLRAVESRLAALQARLPDLEASVRETAAGIDRLRGDVAEAVRIRPAPAASGASEGTPPAAAAAVGPVAAAPASVEAPPPVGPVPGLERAPERQYRAALAAFRAGEHGQAVLDFMDFIARHARHPLAVDAQYWIGEAYYTERDFRHALIEFGKVLEVAPRTARAGDALVKIGHCHARLNDRARARATWERVVREHPRTRAAARARALLAAAPPR